VTFGVIVALVAFFMTLISDAIDRWKRRIEDAAVSHEREMVKKVNEFKTRDLCD